MIAAIGAFLGIKRIGDWLVLAATAAVVGALLLSITMAFQFVSNLQKRNETLAGAVITETVKAASAEAETKEIRSQFDETARRLSQLEMDRAEAVAQAANLAMKLRQLEFEKDLNRDPDQAIADFNARSRELNRMLERATGAR